MLDFDQLRFYVAEDRELLRRVDDIHEAALLLDCRLQGLFSLVGCAEQAHRASDLLAQLIEPVGQVALRSYSGSSKPLVSSIRPLRLPSLGLRASVSSPSSSCSCDEAAFDEGDTFTPDDASAEIVMDSISWAQLVVRNDVAVNFEHDNFQTPFKVVGVEHAGVWLQQKDPRGLYSAYPLGPMFLPWPDLAKVTVTKSGESVGDKRGSA